MGKRVSIPHDGVDCPENIWANSEQFHHYWDRYSKWWQSYYRRAHGEGLGTRSVKAFKAILGDQDTTVVFRHRNWVWHNEEEGWTLYVNKRGPAFHVHRGMTSEEAWEAFMKFRAHVDEFFAART